MAERKFKVGDLVRVERNASLSLAEALLDDLSVAASTRGQATGIYEVMACLPAVEGQFQYRIRGQSQQPQRIVLESQLTPAGKATTSG
jgi:hypothetical protein